MKVLKNWSGLPLFRTVAAFVFSVVLMVLTVVNPAEASPNTTSAASRTDAQRISERKEEAPHYPNPYHNQRSIESFMEDKGVKPDSNAGLNRADQTSQRSDRNMDSPTIVERSQQGLENLADTVREKLRD